MEKITDKKEKKVGEIDSDTSYNSLLADQKKALKKKYPNMGEIQLNQLAQMNVDAMLEDKVRISTLKPVNLGSSDLSTTYKDSLFEESDN